MHKTSFIKYYLSGYVNHELEFKYFVFKGDKKDYQKFKFQLTLNYIGFGKKINFPNCLYGFLAFIEYFISIFIITGKMVISTFFKICCRTTKINIPYLTPGLEISNARFQKLYGDVINKPITAIKIPYLKTQYASPKISLYRGIKLADVFYAYFLALKTICYMYWKYIGRDFLFRNYSSFEYYLMCFFVLRNPNVTYIFHNQIDRWAMLFSNAKNNIFIQHGKIEESAKFIKINAPKKAYYLNESQKKVLDVVLFKDIPIEYDFRPHLKFTNSEKLINNHKKNVLIVSGLDFLDEEIPIIKKISKKNINIYLKPHPKDKSLSRYEELKNLYDIIILDKDEFPNVDVVVSYNSTLAYEYEDAGVQVIRYDLLKDINTIMNLI